MSSYSVAQAKTHLSKLIDEALSGVPVTITRHGKPAAELRAPVISPTLTAADRARVLDEIAARRKSRPSLGESGVDIIRKMRDGEF